MRWVWNESGYLLTVLIGLYFIYKHQRIFSQNLHNESALTAIFNRCDKPARHTIFQNTWSELLISFQFFSLGMMVLLIERGGVGALFWFLFFSFFLKYSFGVVTALAVAGHESRVTPSQTMSVVNRIRNTRNRSRLSLIPLYGLVGFQLFFLLLPLQPGLFQEIRFSSLSLTARVLIPLLGLCAVLVLRPVAGKGMGAAARAFVLIGFGVLLFVMVTNLQDMGLILLIVLRDAIQWHPIAFPLCSRGWGSMLPAAAMMSAVSFLQQILLGGSLRASRLPHPIFYTINAQLSFGANTWLQFLLGLIFLTGQTGPVKNRVVLMLIEGLCLVNLAFYFEKVIQNLIFMLKYSKLFLAIMIAAWLAAFLLLQNQAELFQLISAVAGGLSLAVQTIILSGSVPYFVLLADYRDLYVWHQKASV